MSAITKQDCPTYDQMMQPTISAIHSLGGKASNAEIAGSVIELMALPVEIADFPHGDNASLTEVEYRLNWTRTYLKSFGLIDNLKRGEWSLTEAGRESEQIDPSEIVVYVKQKMKAEKESKILDISGDPADLQDDAEPTKSSSSAVAAKGNLISPTPDLPTYAKAIQFLGTVDGVSATEYQAMYSSIWSHRGSPQETTEWSDPDNWIPERLVGVQADLAMRIWTESGKSLNPRYVRGAWYLANKHSLLVKDGSVLQITPKGQSFMAEPEGDEFAAIDRVEGILTILRLVAENGPGRRSDFLDEFADYSRTYTTHHSETAIKGSLYRRLMNLIDRGYVLRRGQSYEITDSGLSYLETYGRRLSVSAAEDKQQADIFKIARSVYQEVRDQLQSYLSELDPIKFEELVQLLLEEMGYQDVTTTSPTNDKGVDVIGHIELGITSVKEVIQVKRYKGSTGRPVLDQLRGSLHRFDAVRGTIITTGKFTKGAADAAFERGAAPITLIDGEKLLDLLMDNEIGVTKKTVPFYEFSPEKLAQFETDDLDIEFDD